MLGHVDIGGKDRDQESNQARTRGASQQGEKQPETSCNFCHAAHDYEQLGRREIRRDGLRIEARLQEMKNAGHHEEDCRQPTKRGSESFHG